MSFKKKLLYSLQSISNILDLHNRINTLQWEKMRKLESRIELLEKALAEKK